MSGVNSHDLAKIVNLYAENALLIPTFSNRILNTPEKIRGYFEMLTSRDDLNVILHEKPLTVQPLGGSLYAMAGIYCWRLSIEGEPLSFEARFTLLVDLAAPSPILHHHSSQIPRTL
jgi:hypothetical protein